MEPSSSKARVQRPASGAVRPPVVVVQRFLAQLRDAYRRLRNVSPLPGLDQATLDDRHQSLTLGEAAVRYSGLPADPGVRAFHVGVMGPTQTGKSTLVNLLLGRAAAEVSPLAGFTVHPHGFWVSAGAGGGLGVEALFPGWERVTPERLGRHSSAAYTLVQVDPPASASVEGGLFAGPEAVPNCVVWDTPDFDSLAARDYARGVLEVAALADLHVMVLSKEKYSDLSVWRMLELLAPLERPLVVCVNKLTADAEEVVLRSLRQRFAERGYEAEDVPIIRLAYDEALASGDAQHTPVGSPRLQELTRGPLEAAQRGEKAVGAQRVAGVQGLVRGHWDTWCAPVRAEHAALAEWDGLVAEGAQRFLESYERDYLDHPQRYDAFRRAALELGKLLELPHVGGTISQVRAAVTWVPRRVMAAGLAWWRDRQKPAHPLHSLGAEAAVLIDTVDALLTSLHREIMRKCNVNNPGAAVWQALARRFDEDEERLRRVLEGGIQAHHERVNREVRAAAGRLYEELRKHPGRLNALRGARAFMDVGYVILAVKSGGLTPVDAVWAPATFAATSMVMDTIAGFEMQREALDLKREQRAAVEEAFVKQTLVRELQGVAGDLDEAGLFGVGVEDLAEAERARQQWEAGRG